MVFSQILWWVGNVLESLVLVRSLKGRFIWKYPVFYFYVSYVLLESLLRFYWYTQFFSVLVGYGVAWEIFRQTLSRYAGAARMARNLLAFILIMVLSKVFVNALSGPIWSPAKTTAELERNLRTVQGILLMAVIALLTHYAIPLGRNLKGMILGYGFFIATSVINLTLRSHLGDKFELSWERLQPMAYLFVLLIWCVSLWSYRPNPEPETPAGIEHHYELLAAVTRRRLLQVRAYLIRTVRP